jgi:hypothetical protein
MSEIGRDHEAKPQGERGRGRLRHPRHATRFARYRRAPHWRRLSGTAPRHGDLQLTIRSFRMPSSMRAGTIRLRDVAETGWLASSS